ncbi:MAG: YkgJ family cysteine cluster protein [Candidatus Gastranaerophilaceae bacterium]
MLKKYDNFIRCFQKQIDNYFAENSEYIYCHEGCSACCEVGEYPFSWIEMGYLMEGFMTLPENVKHQVKLNVLSIKEQKLKYSGDRFEHKCPFLINNKCCVYEYRGITCRVHGLAYLRKDGTVNVPFCANNGLNYSSEFKDGIFSIEPIKKNLNIDVVLKDFNGEMGEIRPIVEWF